MTAARKPAIHTKAARLRGQAEILGIAFVVVLLVLGLLFYIALGGTSTKRVALTKIHEARNFGTSLEAAMLDTTVENCGFELSIALQKCAEQPLSMCSNSEKVCDEARTMMETLLEKVLNDRGYYYYAEVTKAGSPLENTGGDAFIFPDNVAPNPPFERCDLDDEAVTVYATPVTTVGLSAGTLDFMIAFCER